MPVTELAEFTQRSKEVLVIWEFSIK
jgi:hypothetical protein